MTAELDPRPASGTNASLATQVARLSFDRGMTKVEIAAHLGISRFRVARLLESALADGLVRIEYRDAPAEDRTLATALEGRFGLDLCAVATDEDGVTRLAGSVIDGLIGPNDVIGVAWGSTLAAVVREIPARPASAIEVVSWPEAPCASTVAATPANWHGSSPTGWVPPIERSMPQPSSSGPPSGPPS